MLKTVFIGSLLVHACLPDGANAQATAPAPAESAASAPQTVPSAAVVPLPEALEGRWQRFHPQALTMRGNTTAIKIDSQAGGRVTGKYTLYPQVDGRCETTVDKPFDGTWDGNKLEIYVRREPDCRNFQVVLTRGEKHFLEGRRASDSSYLVYYNPTK